VSSRFPFVSRLMLELILILVLVVAVIDHHHLWRNT
jgi:hypothetical protein